MHLELLARRRRGPGVKDAKAREAVKWYLPQALKLPIPERPVVHVTAAMSSVAVA